MISWAWGEFDEKVELGRKDISWDDGNEEDGMILSYAARGLVRSEKAGAAGRTRWKLD